jgi:hypothetical protein
MAKARAQVGIEDPHATGQLKAAPRDVQESLRRHAGALEEDPFRGTFIALKRVPRATLKRWEARMGELPNLYKLDLPQGWRALYIVASNERGRAVFVIEVVRHTEYDRMLGYG